MNSEPLTVAETARRVREREVSPVLLAQSLLDRIEALDPEVCAWVSIDRQRVLNEAGAREQQLEAGGPLGPLHGVPIGVKDIFMTEGQPTGMGSVIFDGHVHDRDAAAVANLRRAGAVILGKTVTTEFATFDPGPTRNPWNLEHTPGGSSSGSAAAVAAGMCPGATGTQTVASIGRPAVYCGIVGLMPTAARVSKRDVFPVSWSLDHVGAFGRTVDDVALMLEGMADDPIESSGRGQFRIGVVREFFEDNTDPEPWELHRGLLERLRSTDAEIIDLALPDIFSLALPTLRTIMRAELAAAHQSLHARYAEQYGTKIRGLIEAGMLVSSTDYIRAGRVRRRFQEAMSGLFASCDAILSPGAVGPAPEGLDHTGSPILSAPWSLADFPTLSLPHGLDASGMPVGVQLTAPPFREGLLFEIGSWFEEFVGFRERPAVASRL